MASTDRQLAEAETSLGELQLSDAGQEQNQNAEDMANAVKQIEAERSALDSSRKLRNHNVAFLLSLQEYSSSGRAELGSARTGSGRAVALTGAQFPTHPMGQLQGHDRRLDAREAWLRRVGRR